MTRKLTNETPSLDSAAGASLESSAEAVSAPESAVPGNAIFEALLRNILTRDARVAVMGLGYVGLPLVRLFASKGFRVIGCDVDQSKIDALNRGRSYIKSVPSAAVAKFVADKQLLATSEFRHLASADAIFVCVPTPLTMDGKPDVSSIRQTAKAIGNTLRKGQLIVLESTSYPGTTREIMKPELERRGLKCGVDFFLAFSPEREDPGNKSFTMEQIPKIVGGIDALSRRAAAALYGEAVTRVVEVSSCEAAEAAKLLENIYRCVNIALVNELKMCFDRMGIDVWEVIGAASTKPFGFQAFFPGPGLGGHCIPIDPFYLSWKAREFQFNTRFIDLAGELNIQMPYYVMSKLEEALRGQGKKLEGARILMLGLAYKKDIDDPRESPAFKLLELLGQKGADVVYNDPNIPKFPTMRHYEHMKVKSVPLTQEVLSGVDAALVVTDHSDFDYETIAKHAPLIVDTRNACGGLSQWRDKIVRA
ncbi:MAG: nucleotide sugar dehydrogenase [Elusimicrobia bacterium]|nr:nucleotide sugar dehydrogenase [Elusimicrobiota bacterium]